MTTHKKLSGEKVEAFLASHPEWKQVVHEGAPPAIQRSFAFEAYGDGIAFAVRVGFAAEGQNHHPDILIGWRRVQVTWSTHDAGGITAADTEMAERTDALAR